MNFIGKITEISDKKAYTTKENKQGTRQSLTLLEYISNKTYFMVFWNYKEDLKLRGLSKDNYYIFDDIKTDFDKYGLKLTFNNGPVSLYNGQTYLIIYDQMSKVLYDKIREHEMVITNNFTDVLSQLSLQGKLSLLKAYNKFVAHTQNHLPKEQKNSMTQVSTGSLL